MNKQVKELFPTWCNDTTNKYDLIISDDLDSLLSAIILRKYMGYEINGFYDFKSLSFIKESSNPTIGVDIDLMNGYCWGNHPIMLSGEDSYNTNSANINAIFKITRDNYTKKYCGSTVLTILSYLEVDLSSYSEEALMILLAIDSTFLGYYSNFTDFKESNKYFICEVLEYPILYEVLQRNTIEDFNWLIKRYNLNGKIRIYDGKLMTNIKLHKISDILGIPITLPDSEFDVKEYYRIKSKTINSKIKIKSPELGLFSFALTGKNHVSYSLLY